MLWVCVSVMCMSAAEGSQRYMLWRNKASNNTNIILPIGSSLVLFARVVGESLDHRLDSSDKPDLQQWNWCHLFSPPQVSTCASVLRDTPAARRRWRRTSSSRANWTLRTWWKTAARVWGWPSSPGTRCLTVSSNHVCSMCLKCGTAAPDIYAAANSDDFVSSGGFNCLMLLTNAHFWPLSSGSHQLWNDTYSHI